MKTGMVGVDQWSQRGPAKVNIIQVRVNQQGLCGPAKARTVRVDYKDPCGQQRPVLSNGLVGSKWASKGQYCWSRSVESEWARKMSTFEWASEGQNLSGPMGSVWASKGQGCSSGPARPMWPVRSEWISGVGVDQWSHSGPAKVNIIQVRLVCVGQ